MIWPFYGHFCSYYLSLFLFLSRCLDEMAICAVLVAGHYGGIVYFSDENIGYYHETKYSLKTTLIRNGLFASALALAASVFFFYLILSYEPHCQSCADLQNRNYDLPYRSFYRWTAMCCITDKQHTNFMTNCFYFCVCCCVLSGAYPTTAISVALVPSLARSLSRLVSLSRYLLYFDFQYCGYI